MAATRALLERDEELATIGLALDGAGVGEGGLLTIEGEAGADPAQEVRPPTPPRRLPTVLSVHDVERLLQAASVGDTPALMIAVSSSWISLSKSPSCICPSLVSSRTGEAGVPFCSAARRASRHRSG